MNSSPNHIVGSVNAQIWSPDPAAVNEQVEETKADVENRQSLYVEIFQSMLDIVMKREKFLFSTAEQACLDRLNAMTYPVRYLLIRLCLCKRGKWHTLKSLEDRYKIEIGGKQNISNAIDKLCGINRIAPLEIKREQPDVIDLTVEDEGEELRGASKASLSTSNYQDEMDVTEDKPSSFAADDTAASVPELLACLSNDELKLIGKQMKVTKTGQNRSTLVDAILFSSSNQSTLAPRPTPRQQNSTKSYGMPMRQLTLSFARDGKMEPQNAIVRKLVLKVIGRCIRIEPALFILFDRLNLVFFRSTTHNSSFLLPALLAAFRKRQYADFPYVRTASIFASRQALLDYEEALALEHRVDESFVGDTNESFQKSNSKGKDAKGKAKVEIGLLRGNSRAKAVRETWETVYDRWKLLVACKDEEGHKVNGLERFDYGHILTRIVYKGAQALAILKDYETEIEVLQALLCQTKWRTGRRGEWYERLALILMTHCNKNQESWEAAMGVVIRGLKDDLTHLIYRPRLERRLTRLEKLLKIPLNERHKCEGELKKPEDVYIKRERVKHGAASVLLDRSGRMKCMTKSPFKGRSRSETHFIIVRAATQSPERDVDEDEPKRPEPWKGKSRWISRNGEEISVEQLALEYYEDLGFKGFHSEGRIVATIFALLFWDVIFASVPGAFETPYQAAPLDIHEDSFYSARRGVIEARLQELEDGLGHELLKRVDAKERPGRTCCIGVDWTFETADLIEIVDCLGGHALAIICRVICEDYGQWHGGVPDLFVWNSGTGVCKFVEVKGPGDQLRENQKVWIDVLIGSETSVDLCHVLERGGETMKRKKPRAGKKRKAAITPSDVDSEGNMEFESEDEGFDQLDESQGELQGVIEKKRVRDSDDFILSPAKKRRVEVILPAPTRKKRQKRYIGHGST